MSANGSETTTGIIKMMHYEPLGGAAHVMVNCGRSSTGCNYYERGTIGLIGVRVGLCKMRDKCGVKFRDTVCGADSEPQGI